MKVVSNFRFILILAVAVFSNCMSKHRLAQRCASEFPCVEKTATVILSVKHDTIIEYQPLSTLPNIKIRCFEYIDTQTIEIFRFPCNIINTTTIKEKTITILDSAKVFFLSGEVSQLQKDSLLLSMSLKASKANNDKKFYFYKTAFFISLALIVLLAAFLIYRLTRKGTTV